MVFQKGLIPWNKGKKCNYYSSRNTGMVAWNKGKKALKPAWNKGISCYEETKKKISSTLRGNIPWNKGLKGQGKGHPAYGGFNTRFKQGKEHPNFNNYSSFEPYSQEFNKKLKEYIRKKYNYRCQQCFKHQDELNRKLSIHHIDFNKQNNKENNLIPLCTVCHAQTNFNRQGWIHYFHGKVI